MTPYHNRWPGYHIRQLAKKLGLTRLLKGKNRRLLTAHRPLPEQIEGRPERLRKKR